MKMVNFLTVILVCFCVLVTAGCEYGASAPAGIKTAPQAAPSIRQIPAAAKPKPVTVQPKQTAAPQPRITFEKSVHNFGEVAPGSYSKCVFRFTNTGKGDLKIGRTKGTCKCTVPNLKKKIYAPGESGQLKVKFHAPKFAGNSTQHVYVLCNDPNSSRVELTIHASVKAYVQVEPKTINLSLIKPNGGAGEIVLKSIDGKKFAITHIESYKNAIKINYDPNDMSNRYVLKPIVNLNIVKNALQGYILINVNHPKCKNIRIAYDCLREFEAIPSVIIIRNAEPLRVEKRTIFLTSNYDQDIVVESVTSDKGLIKVLSQKKTKNRFEFKVEITPPKKTGIRYFSDTLHIRLKGKVPINIPCRGFYSLR